MSESPPTKVSARRYLAHLIDALIRVAAGVVPFVLLAERRTIDPTLADQYERVDTFAVGALRAVRIDDRLFLFERRELVVIAAIAVGVTLLLDVIVQGRLGWTIGKALTGLRTVKADGGRPGILRALVRTVLLAVDTIPSYLFPLVGGLFVLASDTNRRLGDLLAGTFVVDRHSWGEDPTGAGALDTSDWTRTDDAPVTTLAEGEKLEVGGAAAAATVSDDRGDPDAQDGPAGGPGDGTAEKAPTYQPQWDPARKAYLQWDPRRQTWLQYDDDAGEWQPIG